MIFYDYGRWWCYGENDDHFDCAAAAAGDDNDYDDGDDGDGDGDDDDDDDDDRWLGHFVFSNDKHVYFNP